MTAPADEAEYLALHAEGAETWSTDYVGCGCVPVFRGGDAEVPQLLSLHSFARKELQS